MPWRRMVRAYAVEVVQQAGLKMGKLSAKNMLSAALKMCVKMGQILVVQRRC